MVLYIMEDFFHNSKFSINSLSLLLLQLSCVKILSTGRYCSMMDQSMFMSADLSSSSSRISISELLLTPIAPSIRQRTTLAVKSSKHIQCEFSAVTCKFAASYLQVCYKLAGNWHGSITLANHGGTSRL